MYKTNVKKENYKEITRVGHSRYKVQWDKQPIMIGRYDEEGHKTGEYEDPYLVSCMEEMYNYKPEVSALQNLINDYYNKQINEEIILGFSYEVENDVLLHPYLSNENQMNYKNAYDLMMNESTVQLVLPYKVKNSNGHEPAYYEFTTVESFRDFYISILAHIQAKLHKAWQIKDSIDWSKYEYTEPTGGTDTGNVDIPNNGIIEETSSEYSPVENDMQGSEEIMPETTGDTINETINITT